MKGFLHIRHLIEGRQFATMIPAHSISRVDCRPIGFEHEVVSQSVLGNRKCQVYHTEVYTGDSGIPEVFHSIHEPSFMLS